MQLVNSPVQHLPHVRSYRECWNVLHVKAIVSRWSFLSLIGKKRSKITIHNNTYCSRIQVAFLDTIYTSSNDVPWRNFLIPTKTDFLWFFLSLRNLPPLCSTIRISLLSVRLEPWLRFRNSYSSQAKWFGCNFLDRGKCLRDVLQHAAAT